MVDEGVLEDGNVGRQESERRAELFNGAAQPHLLFFRNPVMNVVEVDVGGAGAVLDDRAHGHRGVLREVVVAAENDADPVHGCGVKVGGTPEGRFIPSIVEASSQAPCLIE